MVRNIGLNRKQFHNVSNYFQNQNRVCFFQIISPGKNYRENGKIDKQILTKLDTQRGLLFMVFGGSLRRFGVPILRSRFHWSDADLFSIHVWRLLVSCTLLVFLILMPTKPVGCYIKHGFLVAAVIWQRGRGPTPTISCTTHHVCVSYFMLGIVSYVIHLILVGYICFRNASCSLWMWRQQAHMPLLLLLLYPWLLNLNTIFIYFLWIFIL